MAIQSIDIADKTTLDSVKQDTTAILNGMGSGGAATPKLIIVDGDSSMAGKTLTIYDDNNLYTHTVTFPADDSKVEVDIDYLATWHVSYAGSGGSTIVRNVDVDTVGMEFLKMLLLQRLIVGVVAKAVEEGTYLYTFLAFLPKNIEEQVGDGVISEIEVFQVDTALCLTDCLEHIGKLITTRHEQSYAVPL